MRSSQATNLLEMTFVNATVHLGGLDPSNPRPPLAPELICNWIAVRFQVRLYEVALLRVEGSSLRFVFPAELRWGGDIPLNSSAMAARTARSRHPELSNTFNIEPHWRHFERIHTPCAGEQRPQPIQKVMSVPAIDSSNSLTGVIQVSRKADTCELAGPDFQDADLVLLQSMAAQFADLLPLFATLETRPIGLHFSRPLQPR